MNKTKQNEQGTTKSYVIGFVLSLIFTIIPYHLVVNKVLTGNTLLITILGIAVLQMFIQIFFFLHLGRGPKPFYNVVFFFATAGIIVLVIGASLFIMNNLYDNMSPQEVVRKQAQEEGISQVEGKETGACRGNKDNHIVVIKDGVARPSAIQANRCDTLTFLNEDKTKREMVFGPHPNYRSYGGEDMVVLDDGRPETITLNESGDFMFHDHKAPDLTGYLSVTP
jgi:cytochrome o ubiquinol oxidase operon protein cyoD